MSRRSRLLLAAALAPLVVLAIFIRRDVVETPIWVPAALLMIAVVVAVLHDRMQRKKPRP